MAEKKERPRVLVINTGGTIGMVHKGGLSLAPLIPAASWEEVAESHPNVSEEALGIRLAFRAISRLVDSSEIDADIWCEIAAIIQQEYGNYDGFVVLHGTDTMCYTASALSFMLENLGKPVVITGAQIPMVEPRSDGEQNVVTAVQIAAGSGVGFPVVPEVCVFFRDHLFRGNRTRKMSASGYGGFGSPNYLPLAVAGEHVEFRQELLLPLPAPGSDFYATTSLDTRVLMLELFPGFSPQVLRQVFQGASEEDRIRGIVLKTYGTGNAPTNDEFLRAIEYVTGEMQALVIDVTQCPEGMVELGLYASSIGLLNRGVVSGLDMTPEAAVCKLMYLLGRGWPLDEVRRVMQLAQRGEQSMNAYEVAVSGAGAADPVFNRGTGMLPGEIDFTRLTKATIRFHNASISDGDGEPTEVAVFLNHPAASRDSPSTDPRLGCTVRLTPATNERSSGATERLDLFGDLSAAARRLLRAGQLLQVSVVALDGRRVEWDSIVVSVYTRV
ncbi:MAG: asparaginase [Coriobacteriales bacterium]